MFSARHLAIPPVSSGLLPTLYTHAGMISNSQDPECRKGPDHIRCHAKSSMHLHRADTWNFLVTIYCYSHFQNTTCTLIDVHHNLFQHHRRCHIKLQHTLFNDVVVSQYLLDHRALDLPKYRSLELVQRSKIYLKRRFAIHELHAAVQ